MRPFAFSRATSLSSAQAAVLERPAARFIAGGTNIVDLMIDGVETPDLVVDINALPYREIELRGAVLRIGALARMSDVADHALVKSSVPMISKALDASASPQLRNAASIGGNLLQRTRCAYFRDVTQACNKRTPGAGCAALEGENRTHALLGVSDFCIATHPSDLAVALAASGATVIASGRDGERAIPLESLYVEPGREPAVEHTLRRGELITAVDVPRTPSNAQSTYLKVRDRQSYEFALVSVAAGIELAGGAIQSARFALGGVGTVPWRSSAAEARLVGKPPTRATFEDAADVALANARPRERNAFKIQLARRAVALAFLGLVR